MKGRFIKTWIQAKRENTHNGYSGVYLVEYFSQAATKDPVLVVLTMFLKVHPDPWKIDVT